MKTGDTNMRHHQNLSLPLRQQRYRSRATSLRLRDVTWAARAVERGAAASRQTLCSRSAVAVWSVGRHPADTEWGASATIVLLCQTPEREVGLAPLRTADSKRYEG